MKAIVRDTYGPPSVLRIQEVDQPVPQDDEILVKIHATSVTFGEVKARDFRPTLREFWMPGPLWLPARLAMGWSKPSKRILGSEYSGVIEGVGADVTRFGVGEAVFGYVGSSFGANAEYLCVSENSIVAPKPHNMTHAEAATAPYGALMALSLLRKVEIKAGDRIMVVGASGGIGQYAVQLVKCAGAVVTGVCRTAKVAFVASLGVDRVIDYTQEDYASGDETYDLVFDIVGKTSFARYKPRLSAEGRVLLAVFGMKQVGQMLWTSIRGGKRVICALSDQKPRDLDEIATMIEAGELTSVVDKCFSPERIADAHRYVEQGQSKGGVAILWEA